MTKTVRVSFMGQKRDSFSTFSDYVILKDQVNSCDITDDLLRKKIPSVLSKMERNKLHKKKEKRKSFFFFK